MKQIKLFLLASILAVFMISCSSSNEPDINDPDSIPDPQYLWKIDIKTKFADKAEIKGAKAGLKGLLSETNWGSVVNIGEDCSVWIGDITKTDKGGNKYDVDFTLYLCPPSALSQGESIKEKSFSINYDLDDFEYDEEGNITEEAMIGIVTKLGTVAGAAFGIPYAGAAMVMSRHRLTQLGGIYE